VSTQLQGERRTVTVLFADLSNFTTLAERLDPEDVATLIRECFSQAIGEIRTRDGWLEKHAGDALLAVFGAPVAHEDDPERAVAAALAIRQRIADANSRMADLAGAKLDVHIGVNTGLAVVTPALEKGDGDDFIVVGDTVNTAARLQQAAKPGQILVGEDTYSATEWFYEYAELPQLRLKGKSSPLSAWACTGARVAERGRRVPRSRTPLVGREKELAVLEQAVARLAEGDGGLLVLTGEPGTGKSRLFTEARAGALARGLLWLEGSTSSYGEAQAYAPFVDTIRAFAGIQADDDDSAAYERLERSVGGLFTSSELAEVLPYLAVLLGLALPERDAGSVRFLGGAGAGLQIFRATRRLFLRLARRSPLALALEDWHWADDASRALLEHLLPLTASVPLLVCCSSRAEGPRQDLTGDSVVELRLEPLADAAAAELVSALAGTSELPAALRTRIVQTSEGNPFFLEQLVRSLRGREARAVEKLEIPATLRSAITARVDQLRPATSEALRIASVLGRSFPHRLLAELVPEGQLERAVDELDAANLVRESFREGERHLSFEHALTHEVVYANALFAERRRMHARVARLLEETASEERLDELAGTLSFHWTRAAELERARSYLFRAGDHAGSVAASAEALAYYRQAVEGHDLGPRDRSLLDRKIGEAFFRRGEHRQAREYLESGLARLGFDYPETTRKLAWTIARAAGVQLGHRLLPIPRYRRICDEPDEWMEELSRIFDTLGWIYFFSHPERIVLDSLRQLNTAERRGNRLAVVRASTGLGFTFDAVPVRWLAGSYHRRAVALGAELENRRSVGIAYLGLAHHQRFQHAAYGEALDNYGRAAAECRSAGDIRSWMGATLTLSEVTAVQGRLDLSRGYGHRLLEVGEDAGDAQVRAWGHHAVGRTLQLAGDDEEARHHLELGCTLSAEVPDYQALVVARGNLGLVMLAQGEFEHALDLLEETRRLADERHLRTFASTDLLKALAVATLHAASVTSAGRRELRRARQACDALGRQQRLDRGAEPAALRLQGTYRWLQGDERRAAALWRRSAAAAKRLGQPYELAWTQVESGRRLGDGDLVDTASTALRQMAALAHVTTGSPTSAAEEGQPVTRERA
jgi:class 3 adenylate cyclase